MVSALAALNKQHPKMQETDLGPIPADWIIRRLDDVCTLINGRGFKPYEWRDRGLPIIRIQNLNGSSDFNYFDGAYNRKIEVNSGQLLFAWSGSRGTSFGPHIWPGPLGVLNYHTWKVVVDTNSVSSAFFYHALKGLTEFIEDQAHGASALVHVQKWQMEKFHLALPPMLTEQEAIGEALSDADALIASLEALIVKKRAIKQGAMQELLSGQRRLPGFNDDWQTVCLSEIADIRSGGTPSTAQSEFWDGDVLWCTPTDITALGGKKFLQDTNRKITDAGLKGSSAEWIPAKSVIMTSRATIGDCAINLSPITTNQGFKNLVPYEKMDVEFLYYYMTTQKEKLISLCGGSTFLEIGKNQLAAFEIKIPMAKAEQVAISTVLAQMDAELDVLSERLIKARQIKQGMMQDLLTGKVRLV